MEKYMENNSPYDCGSQCFFCVFFFERLWLRFKVVHVHEFLSYIICICLFVIFATYLLVKCASNFICLYMIFCIYICI